jgi:hypothetical protein
MLIFNSPANARLLAEKNRQARAAGQYVYSAFAFPYASVWQLFLLETAIQIHLSRLNIIGIFIFYCDVLQ